MPKVSIIIPVYNVEKYLKQCLDSVINQTLKDIEIICVNDCSPDNSLKILREYEQIDKRIKIIDLKENGGLGHARNVAHKYVTSDYIMYLDSDDWLELNACEIAYNQISTYKNDFAFFGYYLFYESSQKRVIKKQNDFEILYKQQNKNNINLTLLDEPFSCGSECWFKIYDKNFIINNNLNFLENCNFEDQPFYAMVMYLAKSVSIIEQPLINYRQRESSITANNMNWKDLIKARKITYSKIKNKSNNIVKSSIIINNITSLLYWFKRFSKKNDSIKKDFYIELKTIFNLYNLKELKKYKNNFDYLTFNNIIYSKSYENFCIKQFISHLLNIQRIKSKLQIYFMGIILSIRIRRST